MGCGKMPQKGVTIQKTFGTHGMQERPQMRLCHRRGVELGLSGLGLNIGALINPRARICHQKIAGFKGCGGLRQLPTPSLVLRQRLSKSQPSLPISACRI